MDTTKPVGEASGAGQNEQAPPVGRRNQFDYYRRHHPYNVAANDYDEKGQAKNIQLWSVIDPLTGEVVGRVKRRSNGVGPFTIELKFAAASSDKLVKLAESNKSPEQNYSIYEKADELWASGYPIKSWWWRLMRSVVHTFDAAWSIVVLALRAALVILAIWFVGDWVYFLFEARDVLQNIMLQWLDGFTE